MNYLNKFSDALVWFQIKGLVLKMFFSFLNFSNLHPANAVNPSRWKPDAFLEFLLFLISRRSWKKRTKNLYFSWSALHKSPCMFHRVLCKAFALLSCWTARLRTSFWQKPKKHKNNFHSAFSQCFNSLKSLDIFFLFRFFVSFSFTSSFVEFFTHHP